MKKSPAFGRIAAGAASFFLAAASVGNRPVPVALGLLCASPPGLRLPCALGGSLGYLLFWGQSQPLIWMGLGLTLTALLGRGSPHWGLAPALGAMIAAGTELLCLLARWDSIPGTMFFLRVGLAAASGAAFGRWRKEPAGPAGWVVAGLAALALAQVAPSPYYSLGYLAAGFITGRYALPAAAMAGLGLDLAQITKLPVTGILCLGFCLRLLPRRSRLLAALGPGLCCILVGAVQGRWDLRPVPGLILGGLLSQLLPARLPSPALQRRGRTGLAQHRLEQGAKALEALRLELGVDLSPGPDPSLILERAVACACGGCPQRRSCKAREETASLMPEILNFSGLGTSDLPRGCKKPARLLAELRRGQEQLRRLRGEQHHRRSYRGALAEQYRLLSDHMQRLAENLTAADLHRPSRFRLNIGICSHSLEEVSGDRCEYMEGPGGHYVLLCDGMGTGSGAAETAARTCRLIRRYLEAGFPAEDALSCYNSLCVLRGEAGWATVDLLEFDPVTGQARLHKWGAGPSILLKDRESVVIGTAGPPPGLSQQTRHWVGRLSLGEGDTLIMLSDGLDLPAAVPAEMEPEQLARWVMEQAKRGRDDATVAAVRLEACPYITTLRQNNLSKHKM